MCNIIIYILYYIVEQLIIRVKIIIKIVQRKHSVYWMMKDNNYFKIYITTLNKLNILQKITIINIYKHTHILRTSATYSICTNCCHYI